MSQIIEEGTRIKPLHSYNTNNYILFSVENYLKYINHFKFVSINVFINTLSTIVYCTNTYM